MVPRINQLFFGYAFHFRVVHYHALFGDAISGDNLAGQGDLNGVAVAVQMPALAGVTGDAVTCIKF